jgi:predicted enzyme related to lactoylglutathione lyase
MTLSQLRILVDDFPTSFHFYREVLGLTPQSPEQESGPYACFKFAAGGTDIALLSREVMAQGVAQAAGEGAPAPRGEVDQADQVVLVFRVEEVDAAYGKAIAAGARSAAEPADQPGWGMRVAHVHAPEGTLIEFCSY